MSNFLDENIKALTESQNEKDDIHKKEDVLYADKVNNQYDSYLERQRELKVQNTINLKVRDVGYIKQIQDESDGYMDLAKKSQVFLDNNTFKGVVPFFPKNVILIGAKSGEGKSTTSANLGYSTIVKGKKVLVITNEEVAADCYNRVTCLIKGWAYVDHSRFSKEQKEIFRKNIDILSHRMTVVDDAWRGNIGMTTTIEGVETILNHIRKDKVMYDLIIIDYYQNIDRSTRNPGMANWEVQQRFAKFLDQFKNSYPAPIVVLSQINAKEDDPFKLRIEGRKIIYNVATCAIEMQAEREKFATSWTIHKCRWAESLGKKKYTGFDKGKYVEFNSEFETDMQSRQLAKITAKNGVQKALDAGLDEINPTGLDDERNE